MLNVLKGKVFENMQKSINIYDKMYIHNEIWNKS